MRVHPPGELPNRHSVGRRRLRLGLVWVEEEGEGDARSSGVHLVAVHVDEAEIQRAEGDRATQLHQVLVVRLVLHDVAHALVDDHLADNVGARRPRMWAALPSSLDRR